MKTFLVQIKTWQTNQYEVLADNEEDAKEKALIQNTREIRNADDFQIENIEELI